MASIPTYADFFAQQDAALRAGMDHAITASLSAMRPILTVVAVGYIAITFMYVAGGEITLKAFLGKMVRLFVIVQLITDAGTYTTYVRNLAFDDAPNAVATALTGSPSPITAAKQFDVMTAAVDNLVGDVRAHNTGWSAQAFSNAVGAWIADALIQLAIAIWAGVWSLGRFLMAIVLSYGSWLLLFELFDRTRGFIDHFVGTVVGLLVYQLAGSILLQVMMTGAFTLLKDVHMAAGMGVDEAVGALFHLFWFFLMMALVMLALPLICAVGSGAAAGNAVAMATSAGLLSRGAAGLSKAASELRAKIRRPAPATTPNAVGSS